MKHLIAATVLMGITSTAMATETQQLRHRFTEYANVVDVQPVFKRIRHQKPQKECWIEQEEHVVIREGSNQNFSSNTRSYSGGDALIGGLIGGVIGNQLGKKSGRGARNGATVAGAIVGLVIANEARGSDVSRHRRHNNQHSNNHRSQNRQPQRVVTTRPVEHCQETMHTSYEQRVQAYDVTYSYRGQTFTTRMKRDPGNRIELQVNVAPARH